MNDPFALDLTIILLLLGVGAAMIAGNLAAFFNKNHKRAITFEVYSYHITVVNVWA